MKPLNLYRKDGDRAVWERAEADAQAAGCSVSDHVAAVLRDQQDERLRRGTPMLEATCRKCGQTFNPADEDDIVHLIKLGDATHGDEECGGDGEIVGEWK